MPERLLILGPVELLVPKTIGVAQKISATKLHYSSLKYLKIDISKEDFPENSKQR